jgi:chromosome segregation ATPase
MTGANSMRLAFNELKQLNVKIHEAEMSKANADKTIEDAKARQAELNTHIDQIMKDMDIAQPGNTGYRSRLLSFMMDLSLGAPQG